MKKKSLLSKDLLTAAEVQELLSISHSTRIKWSKNGTLKSYKLGSKRVFYKLPEIINSLIPIESSMFED